MNNLKRNVTVIFSGLILLASSTYVFAEDEVALGVGSAVLNAVISKQQADQDVRINADNNTASVGLAAIQNGAAVKSAEISSQTTLALADKTLEMNRENQANTTFRTSLLLESAVRAEDNIYRLAKAKQEQDYNFNMAKLGIEVAQANQAIEINQKYSALQASVEGLKITGNEVASNKAVSKRSSATIGSVIASNNRASNQVTNPLPNDVTNKYRGVASLSTGSTTRLRSVQSKSVGRSATRAIGSPEDLAQ